MALNEVIRHHSASRLRLPFTVDHTAGDLVWVGGFYGWVQDDVDVSEDAWGTIHLAGVYRLARVPSTVALGAKLHAPATEIATTLPLISAATNGQATAGWNAVGRVTATGNATVAPVRLFDNNNY